MPRPTPKDVVKREAFLNFPSFLRQRADALVVDTWLKGEQGTPREGVRDDDFGVYVPTQHKTNDEYDDLASRSPNPFARLFVESYVQGIFLDGVRRGPDPGSNAEPDQPIANMGVYASWQRNRMDSRQSPLYSAAFGHGLSFMTVLPGLTPLTRKPTTLWKGYSALRSAAFFDDPHDEFPRFALVDCSPYRDEKGETGWNVTLLDETGEHFLSCKGQGLELRDWTFLETREFEKTLPVCPLSLYAPDLDLDGETMGEIRPVIPLLRRIDQNTFDRLIVQRFGAWKVRYVAGMAKPATKEGEEEAKVMLRLSDLLVSGNKDTKFGTLDATSMEGYIAAGDVDLRVLSAIKQVPPHHLLGLSSNLQAEALAAAEAGLRRRNFLQRTSIGESHERTFRLDAYIRGDLAEAEADDMQCHWADTESRSFIQTVQALGMAADQLKIPLQMLWEQYPGWTDVDVARAKRLLESDPDGFNALFAEIERQAGDSISGGSSGINSDS